MVQNDKNSAIGNTTSAASHAVEYQNSTSADTQDQKLLQALQDLIVRVVVDSKQKNDMNQMHLGPEAGRLITALQDFISRIIEDSQSEAQKTIEVNLAEEEIELGDDLDDDREDGELSPKESSLQKVFSFESDGGEISVDNLQHLDVELEDPPPTFQQKLLKALREHVFNTMPIRLLCFEPQGKSNFQITLLERGAIYARLASNVEENIDEQQLRTQMSWMHAEETEEEIFERLISKYARYAILSHTWLRTVSGEVTYGHWNKGLLDTDGPGYQKLVHFCTTAWKDHQITFGWMDTVCINKESSSELDESIRSMFNWYSRAAVCIIYLAKTGTLLNMHSDPWFTRGWTLQELLAPRVIKFYNAQWKRLRVDASSNNDKMDIEIQKQIERATTISENELWGIRGASISRRMQLAATREVTREEDTAYSLMGIFDISISTAYGEGAPRAFFRLLQEILLSSTRVLDVLNWAGDLPSTRPYKSRILPPSPKYYLSRASTKLPLMMPIEPLTLSHMGLRVPVILMPGISIQDTASRYDHIGDYSATVVISPIGYSAHLPSTYSLLDSRISGADGQKQVNDRFQTTFAVFNFRGARNGGLHIPKSCIAIGLRCYQAAGNVSSMGAIDTIKTQEPIVFELEKRIEGGEKVNNEWFWYINTDELPKHGMQLINLYL